MDFTRFIFYRIPVIHFGNGSVNKLPGLIEEHGGSVLLIASSSFHGSQTCRKLLDTLKERNINFYIELSSGEPSPEIVDRIVKKYIHMSIAVVAGIGGGSVVDTGKAVSAMLPSGEAVEYYLEGVGHKSHNGKKVFYIAVPTTSGTGAEATKNAVISRVGEGGFKKSLRHDSFIPDVAIVDPLLTLTCPRTSTAACGLDALTQLIEAYTSVKASPMTDALCISGIKAVGKGFEESYRNGSNTQARERMAYGALMSGIVLANAGLGIVHGLASPIGGLFPIPHGEVCGTLLYEATCANIDNMLLNTDKYGEGLRKYSHIGELLTDRKESDPLKGITWLKEVLLRWTEMTNMPRLWEYGVRECHIDEIVNGAGNKNNPIELDRKAIEGIIRRRL